MKLLIVEDQKNLALLLKQEFESAGHAADLLHDGAEGERRMRFYSKNYDLLVLDLGLPGIGGLDLLKAIRSRDIRTPVLVLTARAGPGDKITLFDAGADDYVTKPFSFGELLARVRALTRRPPALLPERMETGRLTLDRIRHSVHWDGAEIRLTAKEFGILEFFMRRQNQVVDRGQILAHLWDFAYDAASNVVDVHVNNLRKKLGARGGQFIQTVRGAGYRWRA